MTGATCPCGTFVSFGQWHPCPLVESCGYEMKVAYFACPITGPCRCETLGRACDWRTRSECGRYMARWWLRWACGAFPAVAFVAPWVTAIEAVGLENWLSSTEQRIASVLGCDELWIVGGRISDEVAQARDAMVAAGRAGDVIDLTHLGPEPPEAA